MTQAPEASGAAAPFHYEAQSAAGHTLSGRIHAGDAAEAHEALEAMGLRVLSLAPAEETPARAGRAGRVSGPEFAAFNQQLAQLTAAGLPVERGLRLIAEDMRRGRMAESVRQVAEELERGTPLSEAFDKHRQRFPSLYGRLIDAGVRSGRLPQVLFNLGRHLELLGRLRAELWRGLTYPLLLIACALLLLGFLGAFIGPMFDDLYSDFDVELPAFTVFLLTVAPVGPVLLAGGVVLGLGVPLMVPILRAAGVLPRMGDALTWVPLLGPVLHRSQLSRWCDALRIAVEAGLDLPAALSMASETVGSPRLGADSDRLRQTLEAGRPLDEHPPLGILPGAVPATLQIGSERGDLPAMLRDLTDLYRQQAEMRLSVLQVVLAPIMLVFVVLFIGAIIIGLFLPLIVLMESLL